MNRYYRNFALFCYWRFSGSGLTAGRRHDSTPPSTPLRR